MVVHLGWVQPQTEGVLAGLKLIGFAIWELMTWWVGRTPGALVLGLTFIALGGLLTYYLARLRRFLGGDPS